jgi:hypothetical protein
MTHDELLDKVELTLGTYISRYYGSKKDVELRSDVIDSLQALRAVVELHKPVMAFTGGYDGEETELWAEQCQECSGNGYAAMYPCQTIKDIEGQLQ